MATATIRPNGTVGLSDWTPVNSPTAHGAVDDDPDTPDDLDFVGPPLTSSAVDYLVSLDLEATPTDFAAANTGINQILVRHRYSVAGYVNDTLSIYLQMFDSSSVAICDEVIFNAGLNEATATSNRTITLNAHGLANNNKTMWDGAYLRYRAQRVTSMGADSISVQLTAVEVNLLNYRSSSPWPHRPTIRRPQGAKINANWY
jgi:hypothetical protein